SYKIKVSLVRHYPVIITGDNLDVCVDATIQGACREGYRVIVPQDLVATSSSASKEVQDHYLKVWSTHMGKVSDGQAVLNYLEIQRKAQ
ncbi:isochorismatase family protein, partial [Candidatus Woesearchaeota archaeon]|nr:isochorismatase family protein [Candidatus Woesearchaeota archaeon]